MEINNIPAFDFSEVHRIKLNKIEQNIISCRGLKNRKVEIRLRKENNIRSINSSLAIEGNTMGFLEVRDMINGKTIEGPFDEVLEVKDAIDAYARIDDVDPGSLNDFLEIHDLMTFGQIEKPGLRDHGVAVYEGERVVYKAPDASMVGPMMGHLFTWINTSQMHPVLKGAIVHYYIESIHPFADGNGRMGRYWHTLILRRFDPVFEMVSLESRIRGTQSDYYRILEECQSEGRQDSTAFVDYCLDITLSSLEDLLHLKDPKISALLDVLDKGPLSTSEMMSKLGLRDRVNFRDGYLKPAMEYGFVEMTQPDSPRSPRQRYRRILG